MTASEAISHISSLYPPDSEYESTRLKGQEIMDVVVGNKVGYSNWRDLSEKDLEQLALANLRQAGEI